MTLSRRSTFLTVLLAFLAVLETHAAIEFSPPIVTAVNEETRRLTVRIPLEGVREIGSVDDDTFSRAVDFAVAFGTQELLNRFVAGRKDGEEPLTRVVAKRLEERADVGVEVDIELIMPSPTPSPTPSPASRAAALAPSSSPTPTPSPVPTIEGGVPTGPFDIIGSLVTTGRIAGFSTERTIPAVVGIILRWVFGIIGIIAFITIVVSGFQYLLSAGNEEAIAVARNRILYTIVGIVIIAVAWVVTAYVMGVFQNVR
ncbi:MAG: hypothetical protein HY459_03730 [Parcubacteria group bacterium]|nr:hypothetical protein [Parcubacteria group bacterium]